MSTDFLGVQSEPGIDDNTATSVPVEGGVSHGFVASDLSVIVSGTTSVSSLEPACAGQVVVSGQTEVGDGCVMSSTLAIAGRLLWLTTLRRLSRLLIVVQL